MIYQYYIFEVKRFANGELEHAVDWAYDEDPGTARLKGESKYHAKMSEAALSDTATHSVVLLGVEGQKILSGCYYHNVNSEQITDDPNTEIVGDDTVIVNE